MTQLESTKQNIVSELRRLCAHCQNNPQKAHRCAVREIAIRVQAIRGVPLIVDDEFRGVLNLQYQ
jgi:hypothetical protein